MAKTPKLESAAFTIDEGQVTRHASGLRTQFRFTAPAHKHLDGGFDADVYMVYNDTSISMDRRTMRTLRFFELRGKTEVRAVVSLAVDAIQTIGET